MHFDSGLFIFLIACLGDLIELNLIEFENAADMLFEHGHKWLEVFLAFEELQNLVENMDLAFTCTLIALLSLCLKICQNL